MKRKSKRKFRNGVTTLAGLERDFNSSRRALSAASVAYRQARAVLEAARLIHSANVQKLADASHMLAGGV